MSYHQHQQALADWRKWVRTHQEALARCGIPDAVFESEPRWLDFLQHGWDQRSGWRLQRLSHDGAESFYSFMLWEYGHQRDWYIATFYTLEGMLGLSPAQVVFNRLAEAAEQIQSARPDVVPELEPSEGSTRLWLYLGGRTFLMDGSPSSWFEVREIDQSGGFKVDIHSCRDLEEAVQHVLRRLPPENQVPSR